MRQALRSPASVIALVIGVVGVLLVLYAWRLPPFRTSIQMTENAYVRGQVTIISPQIAAYVTEVAVQDYQTVKAADLLVQLDDRIYLQKLEQAKATLAAQKAALANSEQERLAGEARIASSEAQIAGATAALETAEANSARMERLLKRRVMAQSSADQIRLQLEQAKAGLQQAQAALEVARQSLQVTIVNRQSLEAAVLGAGASVKLAEIDLQNTRILAPQDGKMGEIGVRLGQYISVGSHLAALVPNNIWVVANFKEGQIAEMKIGQPASFTVDALQSAELHGHLQEFSPATGSEFSVLKADNATGNFTKVAQRLPVRITIDPGQPLAERLAPGMSVVVTVDTAAVRPVQLSSR